MKREAINHSKMRRLARVLGVDMWGARGIMESLWYVTSEEAPAGDIGKLSNDDIADAIGWRGDVSALIDGLVQAKWLDATPTYRLVVHDWPEHCAEHIHAKLARARLRFANGEIPKFSKLNEKERRSAHDENPANFKMPEAGVAIEEFHRPLPEFQRIPEERPDTIEESLAVREESLADSMESYPSHPIPSVPIPSTPHPVGRVRQMPSRADNERVAGEFFRWIEPWERVADMDSACRMWTSTVTPDTLEAAFACRDRYLVSDEVARGAWTEPWKFIRDQSRNGWSGKWPRARESATSRPESQPGLLL